MSDRMRVLMVMDSLSVGGTETYVLSLVKAFPRIGVQPVYAGAGGVMYEPYARAGCPIHIVELAAGSLLAPEWQEPVERALVQIMRRRRIDVVHVHQTPSGLYAAKAAAKLGIPVVMTVHGAYYPADQLRGLAEVGAVFISVSKPVEAYLARQGIASRLIPNGVDAADFYPESSAKSRESLGIAPDSQVIVYASRLAWDKASACLMLIRAAHALRQAGRERLRVVIAGDGNQFAAVKELAEAVNAEAGEAFVQLAGNQTEMRRIFNAGDLVVGTGRVALEAMACGKPVLAVGNHGYFGLVRAENREEAWQCYFGDHDSRERPDERRMAEELDAALNDPRGLAAIGEESRAWTLSRFDIQDKAVRLAALYRSLSRNAPKERG
ncbi:glycosyltransferase [Paenibacillus methanolicus]|uniref:Glycosyltransferase involved in cell wall biosynthesis n=1 Tax=Paenibacillus methanolicus TaxID=582686 RepID=A0A5S5C3F2_9BACL|nr:glycosyltransferase [Paenibacillus methanolicus]TYP73951.1 glycosyltransferase involved in cell wall biosynthesis [Paenibacillus methanolicus]